MRCKRFVSVFIILILILGIMPSAFAASEIVEQVAVESIGIKSEADLQNAKISKEEAKEIAKRILKNYFQTEIDEKKFNMRIQFSQTYEQTYAWEFNWDFHNNQKGLHVHVSVDANTGKVLNVNRNEYDYGQKNPRIATITEKEAQKIAEDFIQKINPEVFKKIRYKEDVLRQHGSQVYHPIDYRFRYVRIINGLEFDRNDIMVEIDGVKGTVKSYYCHWDEALQVPSKEDVISLEKAERIFKDKINMQLQYIPYRDGIHAYDRKVEKARLVYLPSFTQGHMLDAKKGIMMDPVGKIQKEQIIKDITDQQKEDIFQSAKSVEVKEKEISQERAQKIMQQKIQEILGQSYEIKQLRYIENENNWENNGQKAWVGQFHKKEDEREGGSITINALTEELISVRSYYWEDKMAGKDFQPKLTWEEAYDKAIEIIKKYFPDKIKEIQTQQIHTQYTVLQSKQIPARFYYFHFPRIVNNILYRQNNITIELDARTGKIRVVSINWDDSIEFPSSKGIISKEEAQGVFFDVYQPELIYTQINKSQDYAKPKWETKLVYRLSNEASQYYSMQIDAFSGKFLDHEGKEISIQKNNFLEKIQGHWAEKELSILAQQGIIDTKNFQLDKEITRMEAITMLVNAKGYFPHLLREAEELQFSSFDKEDIHYKHLQLAVQYNILENKQQEFNPDEKITREEMAEMIIKLLQYEKLAKAKNIYVLPFIDAQQVSSEKVGYVALCKALNILGKNEEKFRPKDPVTMVEMAVAIYNVLGDMN